ncbi:unnamed protein product, partial [Rotaria sp. Silwood1]
TSIPGDATGIPGDATSIPGDATSVGRGDRSIPLDASSIARDASNIPRDASSIPRDASSIPRDAGSILRDASSIPRDVTGILGDATSIPGDATSIPAHASSITVGSFGYVGNEMSEKALDLFEKIDLKLDDVTYVIVFNACAKLANDQAMKIGKKLLDEMPNNYRNNNIVLNAAMDMLMKFGDVQSAERIFDSIKKKNIISYGALMNGYNINSKPWKCFKILEEMKQEGVVLNEHTCNILIGTCSKIGMIRQCQYIIDQIPLHIQNLKQIQTSLINMWSKCGSIEMAQNIFKSVHDQDIMIYNAMISGFGLNGMGLEAVELYRKMPNELQNEVTHICVLNACSHSGLLDEARNIFNEIPFKTEKIVTAMTDCLSRLFLFDEAEKLIDEYEKTNSPSFIMYMCLLSGVRNNRNKKLSEKIYNRMKSLFPDEKEGLTSGTILVSNIYSSVGEYQQAKEFRSNQMKELRKKVKSGLSWTDGSGEIVAFSANDNFHPQLAEIHAEVNRMTSEVIKLGYKCDSSWVTRELQEEETIESALGGHSERLALAFNFIQRPVPDFIQIANNLRICGDCHGGLHCRLVVLPLIEKYFQAHRNCFIIPPLLKTGVNYASVEEEEMNCSLFCKLALLFRQRFSAFGSDVSITVRCLKVLVHAIDVGSVMKNSQEMVRASLLLLFNNIAEDLNQTVQNLEQKHDSNIKGTLQRGTTSLAYIYMVLLSLRSSLLDHLGKNNYGVDVFEWIIEELNHHLPLLGDCLIQNNKNASNVSPLSPEAHDVMTKISRTIPSLTNLIADIEEHAESRVKYEKAPYVVEVILPCLCSYLSYWWSMGPEKVKQITEPQITNVTSNHMNSVLGNVLKLINNNIDAMEAPWMKRIAGKILFSRDE